MKDLFVSDATILQCSTGDDGSTYGIQVQLNDPPKNVSISSDDAWVGVDTQFYYAHKEGEHIGVLVCSYDVMKEKYFGLFGDQGQTFEKDLWSVDSAYGSLDDAQAAYPYRQFTEQVTLKDKTKISDAEFYFTVEYEDRELPVSIDENTFNAHSAGDTISCNFEGYGDFIRATGVG